MIGAMAQYHDDGKFKQQVNTDVAVQSHGVNFGSGLSLLFNKSDGFIQTHIRRHKKDYKAHGEFIRFSQLYNHYSKDPERVEVCRSAFS